MSHADQHPHDNSPSQPFSNKPRTHDFPCAAPSSGHDVSFAGLQTTENSRSQPLSWLLPCRSIDRFQKCRARGSQLGSGEIAKHKPHNKFASSTLRFEGPALRKCNPKHAKPSKQGELTKSRRSKPNKPPTNRVVDWWKTQKQASLQMMKTKHANTPAQSRPPMRRPHPCIVLLHVCAFRAAQSTHSQFLSDCFSLNTLIEHRYQSSKHGNQVAQ